MLLYRTTAAARALRLPVGAASRAILRVRAAPAALVRGLANATAAPEHAVISSFDLFSIGVRYYRLLKHFYFAHVCSGRAE
jgi:hypothetical protein